MRFAIGSIAWAASRRLNKGKMKVQPTLFVHAPVLAVFDFLCARYAFYEAPDTLLFVDKLRRGMDIVFDFEVFWKLDLFIALHFSLLINLIVDDYGAEAFLSVPERVADLPVF